MKKIICLIIALLLVLSLTACKNTHEHDHILIWNKSTATYDNVEIELKDGYFYQSHEKFRVDENTIAVTIYFSNKDDEWEYKGGAG